MNNRDAREILIPFHDYMIAEESESTIDLSPFHHASPLHESSKKYASDWA